MAARGAGAAAGDAGNWVSQRRGRHADSAGLLVSFRKGLTEAGIQLAVLKDAKLDVTALSEPVERMMGEAPPGLLSNAELNVM